jgi:phthiodiolone/phenolphthiodiolone dimycocerosates ketoreductase
VITLGLPGSIVPPISGVLRAARRAEQKGFDAVWWPDHLMGWHPEQIWTPEDTPIASLYPNPHIYLDPVACIAAVGVHTERIRLGTAVTEPVRRHPAMLANEWLTLDHITKGRAILGIGAGEGENIVPYGLSFSRPAARFEEALTIIRLLWEHPGEPVDFDGEFWTLRKAVNGMSPHTPGRPPPIWTGAHGPRMLDATGRLADGWLPVRMPSIEYKARLDRILDVMAKTGRDPAAFEPGMFAYSVVATDHEEAHRILDARIPKGFLLALGSEQFEAMGFEHPLGKGFYGLRDYIPTHYDRASALKAIDAIPFAFAHEHISHGTPDDLAALAREYEAVGCRHLALLNITYLGDATKLAESFHLLDDVLAALVS